MLLEDWYDTIVFDHPLDSQIDAIVAEMGTDGRLVFNAEGQVFHVSLAEKLLILLLAACRRGQTSPQARLMIN
jgi:hypothetical protein